MNLTAISNDGKFLLTSAKDLLDSTPNFLMMYDLFHGILLWEIKENSKFTAIAIFSDIDSVIGATDDGTLQSWNLKMGTKGLIYSWQATYVDKIQLGKNNIFFTSDSTSKDRSIRMWDAASGFCLATFTPDFKIHCCTLSPDKSHIAISFCGKEEPAVITVIEGDAQDQQTS